MIEHMSDPYRDTAHPEFPKPTLTLTEFLLARIAEDEAAVLPEACFCGWCGDDTDDFGFRGPQVRCSRRVLAECEAKRRIVGLFTEEQTRADIYNRGYDDGDLNDDDLRARAGSNARARGLEEAVLALAAVYSDHPDYDPAWA